MSSPHDDLPEWATDRVTSDVDIRVSLWDRVRMLYMGEVRVRVWVDVQNAPGKTQGASSAYVPRIRWPWRRKLLFQEQTSPDKPETP